MSDNATETISINAILEPAKQADNYVPSVIFAHFRERLQKRLGKKKRLAAWGNGPNPGAFIRLQFEPGNQMMRYLIPFSSPAVVTAKVSLNLGPSGKKELTLRGTAHFGLFGGSPEGMLKVAADRAAAAICKQLIIHPVVSSAPAAT